MISAYHNLCYLRRPGLLLDSHQQSCDEFDWYRENFLAEDTDETLGLVFVACQVFIAGTVGDVIGKGNFNLKQKEKVLKNDVQFRGFRTRIELINAIANYYKHKDEGEITGDTLKIMEGYQLLKENYPVLTAYELLAEDWTVSSLASYLFDWRNHIFNSAIAPE